MHRILALVVTLLWGALCAQADFLQNGDFQSLNVNHQGFHNIDYLSSLQRGMWDVYTSLDGWSSSDPDGIEVQTGYTGDPRDRFVELDSHGKKLPDNPTEQQKLAQYYGHNSTMQQSFNVGSGQQGYYDLCFWYKTRAGQNPSIDAGGFGIDGGPSTYAIDIYIDGTMIGRQDEWGQTSWGLEVFPELYLTTGQHTLMFAAAGFADSYGGLLDNINLLRSEEQPEPPVPEPSSYLLVGMGLAGLYGINRRRRKA